MGMNKPKAMIDPDQCHPDRCGLYPCPAVAACQKGIIEQEEEGEQPFILQDFCIGCGKCLTVCPLSAVKKL